LVFNNIDYEYLSACRQYSSYPKPFMGLNRTVMNMTEYE